MRIRHPLAWAFVVITVLSAGATWNDTGELRTFLINLLSQPDSGLFFILFVPAAAYVWDRDQVAGWFRRSDPHCRIGLAIFVLALVLEAAWVFGGVSLSANRTTPLYVIRAIQVLMVSGLATGLFVTRVVDAVSGNTLLTAPQSHASIRAISLIALWMPLAALFSTYGLLQFPGAAFALGAFAFNIGMVLRWRAQFRDGPLPRWFAPALVSLGLATPVADKLFNKGALLGRFRLILTFSPWPFHMLVIVMIACVLWVFVEQPIQRDAPSLTP